ARAAESRSAQRHPGRRTATWRSGLAEYAKRFGVGPGWLFVTGNPEDLETLRQNLGFAWSDPALDADLTNHVGTVRWAMSRGAGGPRRRRSPNRGRSPACSC